MTKFFEYSEKETEYLSKKDKKLGAAIDRIGKIERVVEPDLFTALTDSIVSQQISTKAADTVFLRLKQMTQIIPKDILSLEIEQIKSCGMSYTKANYIKNIATAAASEEFDFENLHNLSDDEFIKRLTQIKGVGVWTAEMMMIFSLQRPNVISYGDLAIRRGLMNLYGLDKLSKEQFEVYKKRYSPYATVASLYVWRLSV